MAPRTWPSSTRPSPRPGSPSAPTRGREHRREVLEESGDEALEALLRVSKTEKLLKDLPALRAVWRRGAHQRAAQHPLGDGPRQLRRADSASAAQGPPGNASCRPGHVWCSVDYSAIEGSPRWRRSASGPWGTLGWPRPSTTAERAHGAGQHHDGRPHEELLPLVKLPGEVKDLRRAGKAANFGFPGGMGAPPSSSSPSARRACASAASWAGGPSPAARRWSPHGRTARRAPCAGSAWRPPGLRRFYLGTWTEMRGFASPTSPTTLRRAPR